MISTDPFKQNITRIHQIITIRKQSVVNYNKSTITIQKFASALNIFFHFVEKRVTVRHDTRAFFYRAINQVDDDFHFERVIFGCNGIIFKKKVDHYLQNMRTFVTYRTSCINGNIKTI